jgi:hypothetical protein
MRVAERLCFAAGRSENINRIQAVEGGVIDLTGTRQPDLRQSGIPFPRLPVSGVSGRDP